MYIDPAPTYYKGTQLHTPRNDFLILMQSNKMPLGPENFRACVRKVALFQLGHFMVGNAQIRGRWVRVEGAYGCNGLPLTVDHDQFELGVDVPQYLYEAWSSGGGWNGPGDEAEMMREWAKQLWNLTQLVPKNRKTLV